MKKKIAIKPSGSSSVNLDFTGLYPSQMQSFGRLDRRALKRKIKIRKILNG